MIAFTLALALAAAQPVPQLAPGEARLTLDGVTTTHVIRDCAIEPEGAMPARLLLEDMDVTLNVARADHMQTFGVIRDNTNWSASRLLIGQTWMDRGQPGEPIIVEWGDTIRVEAVLTSGQAEGEKRASLIARCSQATGPARRRGQPEGLSEL